MVGVRLCENSKIIHLGFVVINIAHKAAQSRLSLKHSRLGKIETGK